AAPGDGISWGSAGASVAPLPPRKVAVQSRVSPGKRAGEGSPSPSSGRPTRDELADPTGTPRPEASQTQAVPGLTEVPVQPSATFDARPAA
ncbi:MAG TPA: hypothetical protein VFO77_15890, partial [Actinoplanes sp.]|nr:hypothetical protein [Actinoplanes sp.]